MSRGRAHLRTSRRKAPTGLLTRIPRRWLYAGAAAAVAALLLGNRGLRTIVKNTLLLRSTYRELAGEKAEGIRLEKSILAVQSDDRALEREARRELGYLKPGEVEYRFPPPKKKDR